MVDVDAVLQRSHPRHALLIDPADQEPEIAAKRAIAAALAGSSMILIGGSSGTDNRNVDDTVVAIKEALELVEWASTQHSDSSQNSNIPVVCFSPRVRMPFLPTQTRLPT